MTEPERYTLEEAQRKFAMATNGLVWKLLDQPQRSPDDDAAMLRAAYTSLHHWLQAGTAVHAQRGEWLLAHVYAVLKDAAASLRHALRCQALTEAHPAEMKDFDRAYALEAIARANALAGNLTDARQFHAQAAAAGEAIANEEDRAIFTGDFKGGEWFGVVG
jgi:hypothetical protein